MLDSICPRLTFEGELRARAAAALLAAARVAGLMREKAVFTTGPALMLAALVEGFTARAWLSSVLTVPIFFEWSSAVFPSWGGFKKMKMKIEIR